MNKLNEVLQKNDVQCIKERLTDMEMEYYTSSGKELVDYYEDFEFFVPNYDKLMEAMGIEDNQEAIITEIYDDEKGTKMNKIDVYKSNTIMNLYFIRMEQYALADEDATISRIIFTENPEEAIKKCMDILDSRNIVMEFRKINEMEK